MDEGQPKLKLSELGPDSNELYELRWSLRERITRDRIIAASSINAMVSMLQEQFDFQGTQSEFCNALLSTLHIDAKGDPELAVFRGVLGFSRLPSDEYRGLVEPAVADMNRLEALIAEYEALPPVQASIGGQKPRNHEDFTKVAFYGRCLEERERISRYLECEVPPKAIELADENRSWIRAAFPLFLVEPPPYELRGPRGIEHLDYRQINHWRHRVRPLPLEQGRALGELYGTDRAKFYAELAKDVPLASIFEQLLNQASKVDKLGQRREVFEEMKTLFEHEHWHGLYALALPSVEGLFSEMLELAGPAGQVVGKALPTKVRSVRQYAAVHAQNLDYFEFVVPNDRNRFAHTGRVANPKLLATEVVYDLAYVVQVYVELETPVIEVLTLVREKLAAADSFAPWARLFELLRKVDRRNQREQIRSKLDEFWREAFKDADDIRDSIHTLCCRLDERLDITARDVRDITRGQVGLEVDILVKRDKDVVDRAESLRDAIDEATAGDDRFFEALHINEMLGGLCRELPLPTEAVAEAQAAIAKHAVAINNLKFLAQPPTR